MRIMLAVAAAATLMQAGTVHAQTAVALVGQDTLAFIDTGAARVTTMRRVEGLGTVLGIDMRPSDGQLYALGADGTVATVDLATGAATRKSKLNAMPPYGVAVTVDFNPVADRMRILGSDGTNLRANVDDGKVTTDKTLGFATGDPANGQVPMIMAGGYTNSFKGAKETTLFDLDGQTGGLFRQAPPNDGILNSVGILGVEAKGLAFDIMSEAPDENIAMMLAGGYLRTVDLASGRANSGRKVSGLPADVRDLAVLPPSVLKAAGLDAMDGGEQTAGYAPSAAEGTLLPGIPM